MNKTDSGFKISKIHLRTEAKVSGIDQAAFAKSAEQAKENCPVSALLKPGLEAITLEARLLS
jgi:lipoyl-dependent peroxiredoxin